MNGYEIVTLSSVLLWATVLFCLVLTLSLSGKVSRQLRNEHSRANMSDFSPALAIGQRAPQFGAETVDGVQVGNSDFLGQRVALVFVTLDCPPCLDVIPRLAAVEVEALESGLHIALVISSDRTDVLEYAKEQRLKIAILLAPKEDNSFFEDFGAKATPSYCIIGKTGRVEETGILAPLMTPWKERLAEWESAVAQEAIMLEA